MRDGLLALPAQRRCHQAAADLLTMYLHTGAFFVATEYRSVKGAPVSIHCYDLPCSCASTYKLRVDKQLQTDRQLQDRVCSLAARRHAAAAATVSAGQSGAATASMGQSDASASAAAQSSSQPGDRSNLISSSTDNRSNLTCSSSNGRSNMTSSSPNDGSNMTSSSPTNRSNLTSSPPTAPSSSSSSPAGGSNLTSSSPAAPPARANLWVGGAAVDSPEEQFWRELSEEARIAESNRVLCQAQRSYPSGYVWGQLAQWFKQAGNDPSLSLTNERKGCVLLPDVESCYENGHFELNYTPEERGKWIARLEHCPSQPWLSTHWTFRRSVHVYGTPMMDAVRGQWKNLVVGKERGADVQDAIAELKQSDYVPYEIKEDDKSTDGIGDSPLEMSLSELMKTKYPEWS